MMTEAQQAKVDRLSRAYADASAPCSQLRKAQVQVMFDPDNSLLGLPAGWVILTILTGTRRLQYGISPEGDAHS